MKETGAIIFALKWHISKCMKQQSPKKLHLLCYILFPIHMILVFLMEMCTAVKMTLHNITFSSSLKWTFTLRMHKFALKFLCARTGQNLHNLFFFVFFKSSSIYSYNTHSHFKTANCVSYISTNQWVMGGILWREHVTYSTSIHLFLYPLHSAQGFVGWGLLEPIPAVM